MVAKLGIYLVALLRRYGPVLAVGVIIILAFSLRQQIAGMDERFFQPSFNGRLALGYYLLGDYTRAAKAYRAHFKEASESGVSSGDSVQDAIMLRDFRKARVENGRRLTEQPDNPDLLITAGEIELEDDQPTEALQHLYLVLQREPYNRDALLLAASAHARLQSFDRAINNLKTALRPNSMGSWDRGFLLLLETAGMLKDSDSKRKPVCLLAHFYRYLRIFDPSNARPAIRSAWKAIEANDRPDDAYLTIGVVLVKQGEPDKALAPILKAVEINAKNAEAYRWAATIYKDRGGDLLNYFLMWKGAYEAEPSDPFYRDAFINFLQWRFGDYQQALQVGNAGLEEHPDDLPLRKKVAEIYLELGEYDQAIEESRRFLAIQPKDAEVHNIIGKSLSEMRRYEESIAAHQAALSINPSNVGAHIGLGYSYRGQRRNKEAIREFETAFRSGYQDSRVEVNLCALYFWESEYRQADACFKHVLQQDPEDKMAQHLSSYLGLNIKR